MIQEVKYNGFTQSPSDYISPDGDLDGAIGLVPEDNVLKPVQQPGVEMDLQDAGKTVLWVHETSTTVNHIIDTGNNKLVFRYRYTKGGGEGQDDLHDFGTKTEIRQVTSVGNTLIVLTSGGMYYFLWQSNHYTDLGSHIPELPLSFGLQGRLRRTDEFTIYFDGISDGDRYKEFSEENKTKITEQVLAKVNKFIADEVTNKGCFMFPFFVRYAYRLYDGSLTMHSAPILMIASSDLAPQVAWTDMRGEGAINQATLRVYGMLHELDYALAEGVSREPLMLWKDIVTGVDIFVSKPIYTYDQSGKCTRFVQIDGEHQDNDTYSVCKMMNDTGYAYPIGDDFPYSRYWFSEMYSYAFSPTMDTYPGGRLLLPRKTEDAVKEEIRNCAQFYFLRSLKLTEIDSTRRLLKIPDDYLQSLVAREVMTDDYDSHDKLMPGYAYGFNGRINVANIKKELFEGFNPASLIPHTDGTVTVLDGTLRSIEVDRTKMPVECYVCIRHEGEEYVLKADEAQFGTRTPMLFFYYPNAEAYKLLVEIYDGYFTRYYELPLERHAMLNGAFYYGGWQPKYNAGAYPVTTENNVISQPNKIYTSEINNPFYFPALGINTVGTGEVLGVCSAAKALSQGQFGQFPLYAFTTEGVWALETSTTGTYIARQPITRDVCSDPESITQLDSSVLFATERGVMMLSGSQSVCITDVLRSTEPFDLEHGLPGLVNVAGESLVPTVPFMEYLQGVRMLYDYNHQRIVMFNTEHDYAYVYSLESKMWGMMASNLKRAVNSYPEALAMSKDGKLVNFAKTMPGAVDALLVTRPLKLGAADTLKTIDTVVQRGHFERGDVKTVLYGSRDLYNWHVVASSQDHYLRGFRGTPYKYYRVALLCRLTLNKSIAGCTVQFDARQTNRVR